MDNKTTVYHGTIFIPTLLCIKANVLLNTQENTCVLHLPDINDFRYDYSHFTNDDRLVCQKVVTTDGEVVTENLTVKRYNINAKKYYDLHSDSFVDIFIDFCKVFLQVSVADPVEITYDKNNIKCIHVNVNEMFNKFFNVHSIEIVPSEYIGIAV